MSWLSKKHSLLIVRAVIVSFALVIWILMFNHHEDVIVGHERLNQKLDRELKRFHTLNDQTLLAEQYRERFDKLRPEDQLKQEDRLALLDELEVLSKKYSLSNFQYTIEARQIYKYNDGLLTTKGLKTYSSDINLEFGVLHESHLMAVLSELRNLKSAVSVIRGCNLKQVNTATKSGNKLTNLSTSYNINTTCQLKWFTFDF